MKSVEAYLDKQFDIDWEIRCLHSLKLNVGGMPCPQGFRSYF